MKLLIASDVHGDFESAEIVVNKLKKEGCDRILFLGDILYHGPRNDLPRDYAPKEVIAMLNERKSDILCVRGNCDTEVDQMVLEFPILADYAILPIGKNMIFATHGHNHNCEKIPPLNEGDILLHGHTHVPKCEKFSDFIYMNPGSVSIPKEDSPNSYMILENSLFEWKDLDQNVYKTYTI